MYGRREGTIETLTNMENRTNTVQSLSSLICDVITKNKTRTFLRVLLALASGMILVGCSTSEVSVRSSTPSDDYQWAHELKETVESVPMMQTVTKESLGSASASAYMSDSWPWGTPRNLTRPLAEEGMKAVDTNTGTSTQPINGNGNSGSGTSPIIVNVNQQVSESSQNLDRVTAPAIAPSSRLESLYRGQFDKRASRELLQFGYDFFENNMFGADLSGPVPGKYTMGPGDEVILSLSGAVEAYHKLEVDRDGFLNIPDYGSVKVAGEQFGSLHKLILSRLSERRHGFDLTVSLGRLRQIQVNIVGRIKNPGVVEIPALGTPLTALLAAGGPSKDGSLRQIILKRAGETRDSDIVIDLYDYLRGQSDPVDVPVLYEGDSLLVPAIGTTVGIAGYVQQPGIYEITTEQIPVSEAIDLAGGLTPFSFTPLAHLERTVDGRGRQQVDVNLTPEGMTQPMGSGELLMVEAVDDDRQPIVRIEGEVARPGDYEHRIGMTLKDLIKRADGLTVDAYLPQIFVSRQLGPLSVLETIPDRKGHLQSRRVLVVELSKVFADDPDHNISLMPLDLVTVRSQTKAQVRASVEIIGAVQRPGNYELTAGMRVSDLVAIAGNPNPDVFYDEAEIIRRVFDEESQRLDVKRFRFDLRTALDQNNASRNASNPILSNGDRLVIRALQQAQVRVKISGRVRFPGEYIFPSGASITDLIAAAGGVLEDADLRAAHFSRQSTRQLQQQRINHLAERTRRLSEKAFEHIVQTGRPNEGIAGKISLEHGMDTMDRIRFLEADGRIVIPFNTPDFPNSQYNLTLENGDALYLPQYHSTVSIAGHVFRPITLIAGETITVENALEQAGGLTEQADKELLYVIRADGSVDSVAQKPSRLSKKTELLAGDVLLVPSKPIERTMGAQLTDALILARQIAEVALVGAQIGKGTDMTIVSPFSPNTSNTDTAILRN